MCTGSDGYLSSKLAEILSFQSTQCGVNSGWGGWGGGGALWVKICRGAPLEVQIGTQQQLIIDLVNFEEQKDLLHAENGEGGIPTDSQRGSVPSDFYVYEGRSPCAQYVITPKNVCAFIIIVIIIIVVIVIIIIQWHLYS